MVECAPRRFRRRSKIAEEQGEFAASHQKSSGRPLRQDSVERQESVVWAPDLEHHARKFAMDVGAHRSRAERRAISQRRLFKPAEYPQGGSALKVRVGMGRRQRKRAVKVGERLAAASQHPQCGAPVDISRRRLRVGGDRFRETVGSLAMAPARGGKIAKTVERDSVRRIDRQRLAERAGSRLRVLKLRVHGAERCKSSSGAWRSRCGAAISVGRRRQPPCAAQMIAEVDEDDVLVRMEACGALEHRDGAIGLPGSRQRQREKMQRLGVLRIGLCFRFGDREGARRIARLKKGGCLLKAHCGCGCHGRRTCRALRVPA